MDPDLCLWILRSSHSVSCRESKKGCVQLGVLGVESSGNCHKLPHAIASDVPRQWPHFRNATQNFLWLSFRALECYPLTLF